MSYADTWDFDVRGVHQPVSICPGWMRGGLRRLWRLLTGAPLS